MKGTTLPILVWVLASINYWKVWFLTLCSSIHTRNKQQKFAQEKLSHKPCPFGCLYPVTLIPIYLCSIIFVIFTIGQYLRKFVAKVCVAWATDTMTWHFIFSRKLAFWSIHKILLLKILCYMADLLCLSMRNTIFKWRHIQVPQRWLKCIEKWAEWWLKVLLLVSKMVTGSILTHSRPVAPSFFGWQLHHAGDAAALLTMTWLSSLFKADPSRSGQQSWARTYVRLYHLLVITTKI